MPASAFQGHHRAACRCVGAPKDFRSGCSAICRLKNAAFVTITPQLAGCANVDGIRRRRVNQNLSDALRPFQARVGPVLAAVSRLVNTVTDGGAVARPGFASAYPDHL